MLDNWEDMLNDDTEVEFKKEGQTFEKEELVIEKEEPLVLPPKDPNHVHENAPKNKKKKKFEEEEEERELTVDEKKMIEEAKKKNDMKMAADLFGTEARTNLLDVESLNNDSFTENYNTTSQYFVQPRILMASIKYNL